MKYKMVENKFSISRMFLFRDKFVRYKNMEYAVKASL